MRFTLTVVFGLLCCQAGRRAQGEDWTEFRGPTGQGHSSAKGIPIHWSRTENIDWNQEIPGKAWSSPIVLANRVYLTTAVPTTDDPAGPQSLRTICLDARTGAEIWNVQVFLQAAGVRAHNKNSHASPTPITDGQRLFVHFGTNGTACLELDGTIVWTNRELSYSPVHGTGGSPVLVEGRFIVSCDGGDVQFVAALDQRTGEILWKTPRRTTPAKGFAFCTPLVIDVENRKQVVSSGADAVFAYDPRDGREIWKVSYPGGYSVVPRPVYGRGLVFVCTGFDSPTLLAIRPAGAAGDVTESHVAWKLKKGTPLDPSPLLVDDALYLVSDNGIVTCLEADTGLERWQERVGGNFSTSPLYVEGRIYIQSEEGVGTVFRAGDKYEELARNDLGERTLASYAVTDGALFIRTERRLVRIQSTK